MNLTASMRSRLIIVMAAVLAAAAATFAVTSITSPSPAGHHRAEDSSLPSTQASYLGVYENGAPATYQPVAQFTRSAGQQPNLVGYYSGWREPFKSAFAETVSRHSAATIVQMDPTNVSVSAIATGGYDGYLRSFADSVPGFRSSGGNRLRT